MPHMSKQKTENGNEVEWKPYLPRTTFNFLSKAPEICKERVTKCFRWWFHIKFNFVEEKHQVAGYRTKVHQPR